MAVEQTCALFNVQLREIFCFPQRAQSVTNDHGASPPVRSEYLRHVIQTAPERCRAPCIVRARTNAGDLQRLIPIGVEHNNPNAQRAVRFRIRVYTDRFPYFRCAATEYLLPDRHDHRLARRTKFARAFCVAIHLEVHWLLVFYIRLHTRSVQNHRSGSNSDQPDLPKLPFLRITHWNPRGSFTL